MNEEDLKRVDGGRKKIPEYSVWKNMRTRCNNPNYYQFSLYGGRGIKICPEWDDFFVFLRDMGPRPSKAHTLERIDYNGNYCPENCKWDTHLSQSINQRMQCNNRSGYRGVSRRRGKWSAQVNYKRVPYLIGTFETARDAAVARDRFIIENNFPHELSIEFTRWLLSLVAIEVEK